MNDTTASARTADASAPIPAAAPGPTSVWALTLGSVGVVYGDIGTSPLYAFREAAVAASESGPITRDIVLGVLSMILWALIVVVTIKYVLILLRADNNGAVAYRTRIPRDRAAHPVRAAARDRRRRDVSGRLGDHAGDFGAVRRRRAKARDTGRRALRPSDRHCGPDDRHRVPGPQPVGP